MEYLIDTQIVIWSINFGNKFSEDLPIISSDENFKLYVPQIQLIEN